MPQYTHNEIRARVESSHRTFHQIEDGLTDFLKYVPFDYHHLEVHSPKLITIILEIGPELISSLELAVSLSDFGIGEFINGDRCRTDLEDLWRKEKKLRSNERSLTFKDYYCFLDKHLIPPLSSACTQLKGFDVYVMPFKEDREWWKNYNLLRHDKYNNVKAATLRTALKAAGALFWLTDHNSKMFFFEKPFSSSLFLSVEGIDVDSLKKL